MTERIGIVSTAHGRGTGAFIVLEHLMRAWRPEWTPLLLRHPDRMRAMGVRARQRFDERYRVVTMAAGYLRF